jgi:hypothetical protein
MIYAVSDLGIRSKGEKEINTKAEEETEALIVIGTLMPH